ncbi:hypothetical protein QUA43_31150, partial [Microcoleus sp. N9_B4]
MYTLENLQQKNLKELKEIGWQLNVMPDGDRRCRQNWIDALVGTVPPLLQLLEVPPAAQVEPVEAIEPVIDNAFDAEEFRQTHDAEIESYFQSLIEVQAQEPIEVQRQETRFNLDICWVVDAEDHFVGFLPVPADEYLSGRRSFAARPGDRVVEPGSVIIKPIETPPGVESKFGRIVYPKSAVKLIAIQALDSFEIGDLVESVHERWGIEEESLVGKVTHISPSGRVRVDFGPGGTFDYSRPGKDLIKASIQEVQVQEPIAQNAETRPQLDRTESADVHNWRSHPAESVRDSSSAKAEALGSKEGDRVLVLAGNSEAVRGGVLPHQPIELAAKFNDEQPPNRGDGKGRIEPKLSQSAIVPAAKNSPGVSRKTSTAHQLLELFKSSAVILDDSPV